ncbi:MAG TPA: hypothetical protein ENI17_07525, partial [Pseudomonas xinjiangensis]|nr:hypothetical protein [Halopseudomonas xinjiangensis]
MKLDYGASFVIWKVIALLFFPFFLWSFLGGHKQIVLGISTDHLATFFAFLGAILAIWWTGRFGSQELLAASLIILMFCSFIVSIFFAIDQVAAAKNILPHAIYATIAYGGALFFRSRLDFFYKMIFLSAFISSVVVVLSVSTLGMGGWGRATIPV